MNVNVLLFAHLKELAGTSQLPLALPEGSTGADLLNRVVEAIPGINNQQGYLRLSMNGEYIDHDEVIVEDAEVAVFPPVSGG